MHFPSLLALVALTASTASAADNWCVITDTEVSVNCRSSPNVPSWPQDPKKNIVKQVTQDLKFGARCTKEAYDVNGDA
jgi:hypothetical protein